ncbi:hypothetical protein OG735_01350 [Streptomyces sp. NBC_01210]|uniref:hypothetical protein n=1 Tax=Streptomyces sp. NBC_01210 TaxID=2903774 RepID=UPI002E15EAAB|nr:hypothetical protein OG735_01350 [Streptomyces sp. NBC_01210]
MGEQVDPAEAAELDYLYIVAGAKGAAKVRFDQKGGLGTAALLDWVNGIDVAWNAA